jgi:hypothetical protein
MRFKFSVAPDYVRTFKDPNHPKIRIIHAFVNVADLPKDLPLDADPRLPKEKGAVPERILQSLRSQNGRFHLLNRGITISCESCEYDNQKKFLELEIPKGDALYGILDGGHTFDSIRKAADEDEPLSSDTGELNDEGSRDAKDQYVHLEILEGVEEYLADIAEARNFSVALKNTTLAHYRHKFDWLIDALGRDEAQSIIRLSENDPQPTGILDIIQILGAVNPTLFPDEQPAQDAYKNSGKILNYLIDDADPYEFKAMSNVAHDILRLYDHVRYKFQEMHNAPDLSGKRGKFGRTKEAKESQPKRGAKAKATYYWLDPNSPVTGDLVIDKGLAIPLISGFRALLRKREDGKFGWLTNPFDFFDKYGSVLVRSIMNASDESGLPVWAVGRDPQVYRQLTSEVRRWYLEGQFEKTAVAGN